MNEPAQSDLFHVRFTCTVKESEMEEFYKTIQNGINETRKEPGCLRAELARDRDDKCTLYVNEIYLNKAAFDYHFTTPHFAQLGELMNKGALTK